MTHNRLFERYVAAESKLLGSAWRLLVPPTHIDELRATLAHADAILNQMQEATQELQAALYLANRPKPGDHAECCGLSSWTTYCTCHTLAGRRLAETERQLQIRLTQALADQGKDRSQRSQRRAKRIMRRYEAA